MVLETQNADVKARLKKLGGFYPEGKEYQEPPSDFGTRASNMNETLESHGRRFEYY